MIDRLLPALLLVLPIVAVAAPPFEVKGTLTGTAYVVDGDGIEIAGTEVRLQGLAAPEDRPGRVDPGGKQANAALRELVEGREVVCLLDGTLARGRPVGICELQGADLARVLVRRGLVRDCPRYSRGRYAKDEAFAKSTGKDLSKVYALPGYC